MLKELRDALHSFQARAVFVMIFALLIKKPLKYNLMSQLLVGIFVFNNWTAFTYAQGKSRPSTGAL
jgi:hypothetical protein